MGKCCWVINVNSFVGVVIDVSTNVVIVMFHHSTITKAAIKTVSSLPRNKKQVNKPTDQK